MLLYINLKCVTNYKYNFFFFYRFLVLKIDYIYKNLKESSNTRAKYRKNSLSDLMPMIIKTVHKRWFSNRSLKYLKQYITRQKNSFEMNVIKVYLLFFFKLLIN